MSLTPEQSARFARQLMLREVGDNGQRRILDARAAVAGPAESLAHEMAARYARAAGFTQLVPGVIDGEAWAPRAIVTHQAARELLAGSRAALAAIRQAVFNDVPASREGVPPKAAREPKP